MGSLVNGTPAPLFYVSPTQLDFQVPFATPVGIPAQVQVSRDGITGPATVSVVTYHVRMQFGGTVLYVDQVTAVVDFYRRAFGLELRFFDEALGFAELETGGSPLAIAAHSLGEMMMPNGYTRPVAG